MGEQVSEGPKLAWVLAKHHVECTGIGEVTCRACRERSWMTWTEYYNHLADAALAWFAERVEALIDRYDDPGYGMQEDEWRFVRDLRALYATPTTESEER